MKDGEETKVEAHLVFVYQAGDESVGIFEGFYFAGIEVGDDLICVEDTTVTRHYGVGLKDGSTPKEYPTFVIDPQDALKINAVGDSLYNKLREEGLPPDLEE